MTRIYLIRHAEAEGNLYRIAQGQSNSILTDRGWRQIQALERRFAGIHIDAVYSSDLYRTCATASALYRPRNLPLHRSKALREVCVGKWEQQTWGDILREDPEQMRLFSSDPALWHVEGAERAQAVLDRMLAEVTRLAKLHEGETIALFSHGYATRLLLAHLQGYTIDEIGKSPTGDNTSVALMEYDGEKLQVIFRDDNSHLKTPDYLAQEKKDYHRDTALEPGIRFEPLHLPEQAQWFADGVEAVWAEAGETRAFDAQVLLDGAAERTTLVGYSGDTAVGAVQLVVENNVGWLPLLWVRADRRERGYGIQLIGQTVMRTRAAGGEFLRMAVPKNGMARTFLKDYGFYPVEDAGERVILEKDIRFDPQYLSE